MSYLEELTRDQFLSSIANQRTRESYETALNQFDEFCKNSFEKKGDVVIIDLRNHIRESQDGSGVYRLLQSFVNWLNEDHPELSIKSRNHSRPMTKRHPSTIKHYVSCIKQYVEEFGNIDIIDRKYQKRVKIPKKPKEELEPFTRNEIRDLIDHSSFDRKVLYMTLKDSGMRIGEAVQIRKCHVDLTKNPVEIHVPANITKTKTSRTTFVTRETAPMLRKRLEKIQDNDLVFGKNENPKKAVVNEEMIFKWYRDKLGMTDRYESNNRHKKNLHSLRAFTSTQIADVHGEEFAHGFIGHSKYLGQYIRRKEKIPEMYKRAENRLMIYEQEIIVENTDSEIDILKKQVQRLIKETIQQKEQLEIRNRFLEQKLLEK